MKITSETSLSNFDFWSGGLKNSKMLTLEELDQLEQVLEELFFEGITDTEINNMLWFDFEWVCENIGLKYDVSTHEIKRD